jgi:hypothetical protein
MMPDIGTGASKEDSTAVIDDHDAATSVRLFEQMAEIHVICGIVVYDYAWCEGFADKPDTPPKDEAEALRSQRMNVPGFPS